MRNYRRWLTIPLATVLAALIGINLRGSEADDTKPLTAEDVIKLWEPRLRSVEDFQQFVASPKGSTGLAAATFRVVGPTFEDLWNHYAHLCGITDPYKESQLQNFGGSSARGSFVVSDRGSLEVKGRRGLSVFVLRTERYTVTATIQPDPDGKAMLGSLSAVTP
jgi:hypothetical protein